MYANIWKLMKENKLEVDNEINNDLICGICKCLMINACHCPCGCRFCSDCIEHYLDREDKFCPGTAKYCQVQTINFTRDVSVDPVANLKITEITVKCPRKNCQFKEQLCMIENHMKTCDKRPIICPFNSIGCEINEVMNEEMRYHLKENNFCHSKLLIDLINNLRNEMESVRNEMIELKREHKQKLDIMEMQFTNQQQKIIELERKENDNTKEIEMLNEEMDALKNENRSQYGEMDSVRNEMIGLKNEHKQKLAILELQFTNQQQKIIDLERKENDNTKEIEMLNEEMVALKNQNRSQKEEMVSMRNEMIELKRETETKVKSIQEIRQQIEANETKSQQQMNELKQNYQQQRQQEENKIVEMEKCANEIRLIQTKLESDQYKNFELFEWRVEKLSQQKRGELIYSKPFYSGPSGYKMCLAVFIWGSGDIGVWFHLMRGESDDKLDWPFKRVITVDVINPADGNVCLSETIKYSDCPDAAGWRKPIKDRNDPIYVYDYINNKCIPKNSAAIKNDLLQLKCKID